MRSFILLSFLLCSLSGFSQTSINNYKYVLVPEQFSFQKEAGQYGLNNLAISLLEQNGFTAWLDNAKLPAEIATNKCSALIADVVERKSLFVSRLTLLLKDCRGNVLFKGKEGTSREKDYGLSYTLALRDAFTSLANAKYEYQPLASATVPRASLHAAEKMPASNAVATPAASGVLYAQPIANGYQLIDTTPRTVLRIFKSSVPDLFIAENGTVNGILFKKENAWIFEYYKEAKLMAEKLLIKF